MWRRQPIDQLLADPQTPRDLRARLALVQQVLEYARELSLAVDEQYTSYVPWPGDRVITTLVATRPGETEAAKFRFPIVGRVPYKGFFDRDAAEREAESLRARGFDICLGSVAAYSTLGWLDDPLTEPMLLGDDLELIETILHELVHATAYIADDAEFNEGVASFVGREAAARYLHERGLEGDARAPRALEAEQRARTADARLLGDTLQRLRGEVEVLYGAGLDPTARRVARAELDLRARGEIAALPLRRKDNAALATRIRLGDACLALRGTYSDDLELHAALLRSLGGDLRAFVARLAEAASADAPREAFFTAAH
jgi:predicted aminopeptidase